MDVIYDIDTDANPRVHLPHPILENSKISFPDDDWPSVHNPHVDLPRKPVTKQEHQVFMKPDPFLELTPQKRNVQFKDSSVNTCVTMLKKEPKKCVKNLRLPTFVNGRELKAKSENGLKGKRKKDLAVASTLTSSMNPPDSIQWFVYDHTTGEKLHNKERKKTLRDQKPPSKSVPSFKKDKMTIIGAAEENPQSQYTKPEFNSSLKLANKLLKLRLTETAETKSNLQQNLPEGIKTKILEKAAAQVNVPLKAKQYKNLIPIEETADGESRCLHERESKSRNVLPQRPKDLQPDIADYMHEFKTHEFCHLDFNFPPLTLPKKLSFGEDYALNQYRLLCTWDGITS